jgi:hypothetical protein
VNIDPKDAQQFEAFAIEAVRQNVTNLRLLVHLWSKYLEYGEGVEHDIRKDPASKLIVALLAHQMGLGIRDLSAPHACIKEIQRERH